MKNRLLVLVGMGIISMIVGCIFVIYETPPCTGDTIVDNVGVQCSVEASPGTVGDPVDLTMEHFDVRICVSYCSPDSCSSEEDRLVWVGTELEELETVGFEFEYGFYAYHEAQGVTYLIHSPGEQNNVDLGIIFLNTYYVEAMFASITVSPLSVISHSDFVRIFTEPQVLDFEGCSVYVQNSSNSISPDLPHR